MHHRKPPWNLTQFSFEFFICLQSCVVFFSFLSSHLPFLKLKEREKQSSHTFQVVEPIQELLILLGIHWPGVSTSPSAGGSHNHDPNGPRTDPRYFHSLSPVLRWMHQQLYQNCTLTTLEMVRSPAQPPCTTTALFVFPYLMKCALKPHWVPAN